jgi:predicted ester cyclase
MNGFDSEFKNLKDYILKITYRIWEERGVERIRDYYGEKAPVKTPTSVSYSVEDVISSTWDILKMFPDRQLIGEDVIGSEDLPGTFYSSHRILSTATHLGDGFYGSPSGSKLTYRVIGDCICRENKVIDEWMVRDQSAIVKQTGLEPDQFARQLISKIKEKGSKVPTAEEYVSRWTGPPDSGPLTGAAKNLAQTYQAIWEQSEFSILEKSHNRASQVFGPGARVMYGSEQLVEFLKGYTNSLPKGSFRVHHWIVNEEEGKNTRIALRWSYSAKHTGFGSFGEPTGAPVVIMAMTHAELQEGLVVREYHAIDEVSIWMQIIGHSN